MAKKETRRLALSVRAKLKKERDVRIGVKVEQRFRKALSRPYSSPLRLTQAKSSQELWKMRTLAGVSWSELKVSTK